MLVLWMALKQESVFLLSVCKNYPRGYVNALPISETEEKNRREIKAEKVLRAIIML